MDYYFTSVGPSGDCNSLGDVIICDDDGSERMIIERKTLNDLAASIKDGRYEEQGYRLSMRGGQPSYLLSDRRATRYLSTEQMACRSEGIAFELCIAHVRKGLFALPKRFDTRIG